MAVDSEHETAAIKVMEYLQGKKINRVNKVATAAKCEKEKQKQQ